MLIEATAMAMLPAKDLRRASAFFSDVLGLKVVRIDQEGRAIVFEAVSGSRFAVFAR
jgi:catechol 2,3-dioxygenase-like lactoylglutathione lyase family enzyme